MVGKIEKGKRAMKLDLVTRNAAGQVMTDDNTPVAQLFSGFQALRQEKKKQVRSERFVLFFCFFLFSKLFFLSAASK